MDIYHYQYTEENHAYLSTIIMKFHGVGTKDYSFLEEAIDKGIYKKVATVATTNLDESFKLTNHIEEDWALNPEVTAYFKENKSSSVGDIFVLGNEAYIVQSLGFEKLDAQLTKKLISSTKTKLKM